MALTIPDGVLDDVDGAAPDAGSGPAPEQTAEAVVDAALNPTGAPVGAAQQQSTAGPQGRRELPEAAVRDMLHRRTTRLREVEGRLANLQSDYDQAKMRAEQAEAFRLTFQQDIAPKVADEIKAKRQAEWERDELKIMLEQAKQAGWEPKLDELDAWRRDRQKDSKLDAVLGEVTELKRRITQAPTPTSAPAPQPQQWYDAQRQGALEYATAEASRLVGENPALERYRDRLVSHWWGKAQAQPGTSFESAAQDFIDDLAVERALKMELTAANARNATVQTRPTLRTHATPTQPTQQQAPRGLRALFDEQLAAAKR